MVSLALLAASLWMWGRSYWFDDQLQRKVVGTTITGDGKVNLDRLLWIGSSRGKLAVMTVETTWVPMGRDGRAVIQWWWSEDDTSLKSIEQRFVKWNRFFGFGFGSSKVTMGASTPPIPLAN